jgi:hypothetical protein
MPEKCAICASRRPKRSCPGLRGDICPQCCGQEREETVACPLDCIFLRQGREHEKLKELSRDQLPHPEVQIPDSFLREQEFLVLLVASIFAEAVGRIDGLIDYDAREALASLVQTYKTLGTGLIYESKPANPLAAALHELVQLRVSEFRQRAEQEMGVRRILDSHVLGVLIFFQRMEFQLNNGRRRGRSFLDGVLGFAPRPAMESGPTPSLLAR